MKTTVEVDVDVDAEMEQDMARRMLLTEEECLRAERDTAVTALTHFKAQLQAVRDALKEIRRHATDEHIVMLIDRALAQPTEVEEDGFCGPDPTEADEAFADIEDPPATLEEYLDSLDSAPTEATEDEPVFDDGMDDDEPECECLGVHSSLCPVWQRRMARGMEMMLEWQQSKQGMFEPSKAFIAAHRKGEGQEALEGSLPSQSGRGGPTPDQPAPVSSPISREQAERAKALKADIAETRKSLSKLNVVGVPIARCFDWEEQIDAIIEAGGE